MANFFQKFKTDKIKIYKYNKIWFIIPIVIIFIAMLCGTIYQLDKDIEGFANIGIDFQGGTVLQVEMIGEDMNTTNKEANYKYVDEILTKYQIKLGSKQPSGTNAIIFRYKNVINNVNHNSNELTDAMSSTNKKIVDDIETKFKEVYGDKITITASTSLTGATASSKLIGTAFLSVGIAIVLILIYIMIRFDAFSGIGAIIALLHDILMMLAFTIIFRIQINSAIVAGIITIVAYSINNTIVIFDRLRENIAPFKTNNDKLDVAIMVDKSVLETMTRSVYTTLTTLFTISMLAILGVPAIKEFALPILFGLISGFYSSICIAPSIWGLLTAKKQKMKNTRNPIAPKSATPPPTSKLDKKNKKKAEVVA